MNRALLLVVLPALVVANVAGAFYWKHQLAAEVRAARQAVAKSPQAQLKTQRAQLEALQEVVRNWELRPGFTLAAAQALFEQAATGWVEISLGSSGLERDIRLDVLTVRGLSGSSEQLTRVDRRLAPRCQHYRRTPTREGTFILSCQLKPRR